LNGEKYVKAHHRRELLKLLDGRTDAAVERKHQNISAILQKHGHPFIDGYKPLNAFQGLLEEVVLEEFGNLSNNKTYPQNYRSWTLYSPQCATKQMDKSSFLHHGTGIPKEFAHFFEISADMKSRDVTLVHKGVEHPASLTPDPLNIRIRLFWRSEFSAIIEKSFPSYFEMFLADLSVASPPHMKFVKENADLFQVSFIIPSEDESDRVDHEDFSPEIRTEGAKKSYKATRYERNPRNRLEAIRIHGTSCSVCGLNFGEKYGDWGEGFIEIHHINPLALEDIEQEVNPETDLVPVCANCHRMIHRHGKVLSIEEAKSILKRYELKPKELIRRKKEQ
jgi:5-methylcytosine-specific restriction protein A